MVVLKAEREVTELSTFVPGGCLAFEILKRSKACFS